MSGKTTAHADGDNVLFAEPPRTQFDLNFSIARIPVRVHPLFWLAAVILGASANDGQTILIWVAVVFVSILVHELGHAFTIRYFGERPRVLLYLMGGLAISGRSRSSWHHIIICAAGPAAGFALAALTVASVYAGGGAVLFNFSGGLAGLWEIQLQRGVPMWQSMGGNNFYLHLLINDMLWVNIFWGLINLLPVYPLDGGQIAREIFAQNDPWDGVRKSLLLSVFTGGILAIIGLIYLNSIFMALLFGSLAFSSWQAMQYRVSGR